MGIRFRRIAAISSALVALGLAVAAANVGRHEFRPKNQAELDLVRGMKPIPIEAQPWFDKDRRYYRSRFGMPDIAGSCGKGATDGFYVVVSRSFFDATAVSIAGNELVRVHYPPNLPPAYLPSDQGALNPSALSVPFKREQAALSWWQALWLTWEIRRSGVLRRPYSLPGEEWLDGNSAHIVICDRGLRYEYTREVSDVGNRRTIEPSLARLLRIVGAV